MNSRAKIYSKLLRASKIAVILMVIFTSPRTVAGERYAFLVGVRQYDPAEFTSLRYTEDDVTELSSALRQAGYSSEHIVLMTQTKGAKQFRQLPTSQQIRKQLKLLLAELQADDSIIVVFSGHGVQFSGEDSIYFCPMDAELRDRQTLVSLTEIYEQLGDPKLCKAKTKVMFVDACRNDPRSRTGKAATEIELDPAGVSKPSEPPGGVVAFFSCSQGQKSHELPELGHGIFAHSLINAFRGDADLDGDRDISLAELEQFTARETQKISRIQLGMSQTPERRGLVRGIVSLGECTRFVDGAVPGLQFSREQTRQRVKRAKELTRELGEGDAFIYAILGESNAALAAVGPPQLVKKDGNTDLNKAHFKVLGLLAKQPKSRSAILAKLRASLDSVDWELQKDAKAEFDYMHLATFKNQRMATVDQVLAQASRGDFWSVSRFPRVWGSTTAEQRESVLNTCEDPVTKAILQINAATLSNQRLWQSHHGHSVFLFAFTRDMDAIRQIPEAFDPNFDLAPEFTYFAASALLDAGEPNLAAEVLREVSRPRHFGCSEPACLPYSYPMRLREQNSSGPIPQIPYHHPLGRLGDEAKARELNNGEISADYIFGLLADIDWEKWNWEP